MYYYYYHTTFTLFQDHFVRGGLDFRNVNVNINFSRHFPAKFNDLGFEVLVDDPLEMDVGVERAAAPARQ
jgi:hypothetical protein